MTSKTSHWPTTLGLIAILLFLALAIYHQPFNNVNAIDTPGHPVPLVFEVLEISNPVRVWKINIDGVYYLLASNDSGGVTLVPFDQ